MVRLIGAVRSVRTEMNVPPGAPAPILLRDAAPEHAGAGRTLDRADPPPGARLPRCARWTGEMPKGSAQAVLDEATVVLPLAGTIDLDAERARLTRERDKAAGEAAKLAKKLDNADFVAARRRTWWRRTASGWRPSTPRWRGSKRRCGGSDRLASNRTPIGWARAAAARHEFALCARTEFR